MCKEFEFDDTNKWYLHKPASVLQNDTHKLQRDFHVQTDHVISAGRPDLMIKKREFAKLWSFLSSKTDHRIQLKESEKKEKYLHLARELIKTMEHEGDNYTNCDCCFCTVTKEL